MSNGLSIKDFFFGIDDEIICFYLDQVEDLYASMMPCVDDWVWVPEDKAKCECLVNVFGGLSDVVRSGNIDSVDMDDPFILFLLNNFLHDLLSGNFCQYDGRPW